MPTRDGKDPLGRLRRALIYSREEDRLWAPMRWNLSEDERIRERKLQRLREMHRRKEK